MLEKLNKILPQPPPPPPPKRILKEDVQIKKLNKILPKIIYHLSTFFIGVMCGYAWAYRVLIK